MDDITYLLKARQIELDDDNIFEIDINDKFCFCLLFFFFICFLKYLFGDILTNF